VAKWVAMEKEPSLSETVARLEEEVALAEHKLGDLAASIRAATVEIEASRDPAQFEWTQRAPQDPVDQQAVRGFLCGMASGVGVCFVVFLVLRLVGR